MGDFNLRDRGRSNDEKLLSRTSGHFNHLIAGNITDATVACLCTLIKLLKKTRESNRRSNVFKTNPLPAGGRGRRGGGKNTRNCTVGNNCVRSSNSGTNVLRRFLKGRSIYVA